MQIAGFSELYDIRCAYVRILSSLFPSPTGPAGPEVLDGCVTHKKHPFRESKSESQASK